MKSDSRWCGTLFSALVLNGSEKWGKWASKPRQALVFAVMGLVLEAILLWKGLPLHILDAKLFYSPHEAIEYFAALGLSGRATYLGVVAVDLCFISVYVSFLQGMLYRTELSRRVLVLGPLIAFFDYAETLSIGASLWSFPAEPWGIPLVYVAVMTTPLKWISIVAALFFLLRNRFRS